MLRSAKKINITAKTMQNYDGMIIAPSINFLGLIITCNSPIDARIKEFFSIRGGVIGRTKIEGELFVKLTGEFNITIFEIEEFLKNNSDLNIEELSESDNIETYSQMRQTIRQAVLYYNNAPRPLQYTNGKDTCSSSRGLMQVNDSQFDIKSDILQNGVFTSEKEDKSSVTSFTAGRDLIIQGASQTLRQTENSDEIKIGVLGNNHSMNNLNLNAKRSLEIINAVVDVANFLDINASPNGNIKINLEKDVEWLNNPYPTIFNQFINHKTGTFSLIRETPKTSTPGVKMAMDQ